MDLTFTLRKIPVNILVVSAEIASAVIPSSALVVPCGYIRNAVTSDVNLKLTPNSVVLDVLVLPVLLMVYFALNGFLMTNRIL